MLPVAFANGFFSSIVRFANLLLCLGVGAPWIRLLHGSKIRPARG